MRSACKQPKMGRGYFLDPEGKCILCDMSVACHSCANGSGACEVW